MVTASLVTDADVDAERSVVVEEIAMNEDDPADTAHEMFAGGMWLPHPVGRPVLGSAAAIEGMPSHQLRLWYRTRYLPSNLVIAAAGNLEHTALVRLVRQAMAKGMLTSTPEAHPAPPRGGLGQAARVPASTSVAVAHRPTEQANIVVGVPGPPRDERRWPLAVLSSILGDGSSSRLFQSVREDHGLAYSVYSFFTSLALSLIHI